MKENYKPGSMGAAENKSTTRWFIGATLMIGIITLLFSFPIFDNNLNYWFKKASWVSKAGGYLVVGAWLYFLWQHSYNVGWGKKFSAVGIVALLLIALALIFGLFAGFNFDLSGTNR